MVIHGGKKILTGRDETRRRGKKNRWNYRSIFFFTVVTVPSIYHVEPLGVTPSKLNHIPGMRTTTQITILEIQDGQVEVSKVFEVCTSICTTNKKGSIKRRQRNNINNNTACWRSTNKLVSNTSAVTSINSRLDTTLSLQAARYSGRAFLQENTLLPSMPCQGIHARYVPAEIITLLLSWRYFEQTDGGIGLDSVWHERKK